MVAWRIVFVEAEPCGGYRCSDIGTTGWLFESLVRWNPDASTAGASIRWHLELAFILMSNEQRSSIISTARYLLQEFLPTQQVLHYKVFQQIQNQLHKIGRAHV